MDTDKRHPVSIVLNKDVLLTPTTLKLFEGLGIDYRRGEEFAIVGHILSHRSFVQALTVLRMRVQSVMRNGVPFTGLNDTVTLTVSSVTPIQTVGDFERAEEEIYKLNRPIMTSNIGFLPNEEIVIRRDCDLISLTHGRVELQITEKDLEAIRQNSARKATYSVVIPDEQTWRVVAFSAYSPSDICKLVDLEDSVSFCEGSIPNGFYSTEALLPRLGTMLTKNNTPTRSFDILHDAYRTGEFSEFDPEDPILKSWMRLTSAPPVDSPQFKDFLIYHAARFRDLSSPLTIRDGMILHGDDYLTPREYFSLLDGENNVCQPKLSSI